MKVLSGFDRLSRREKVLVSTLFGLVAGGLVVVLHLWVGSSVNELEEQISEHREDLQTIYATAGGFLESKAKVDKMRELAERNQDMNLKLVVNEIAKRISFTSRNRRGEPEGQKKLADALQFDQSQETYVSKKKKKKAKKTKKESEAGYYRRDQPLTLSEDVPFQAVYELLEKIEESEDLLYVTEIEMSRDFSDGRIARKNASITVSTFYYKGDEE